jgi:anti-sigma factor RsiW
VTACSDFDVLITLRATGDLSPDEAKRLELHLAACPRCRAEAEADAAVLRQVRLPPPTDAERRANASLARGTLAELRRRDRRAAWWKRTAVGISVAAAVGVAVLAPALLGHRVSSPPPAVVAVADGTAAAAATSTASWEPDLDTVWNDTAILDEDASASASESTDAAVASLDY